jgi:membrane peptidoglycan carboxypeptidase
MATRKYYRKNIPIKSKQKNSLKVKDKNEKPRRWPRVLLGLSLFGFILATAIFAFFAKQLPNPKDFQERVVKESTKIYDRTGKVLLYEAGSNLKRTYVDLKEISPELQKATIVAEDDDFYHHPGVDIKGLFRALIFRGEKGGGSTITQQFIKNALLTPERTLTRKIKEAILSLELERRYSKDEILEFYLNQIPYGSIFYGAESASQQYFHKKSKDLTLAQAATLASLPQSPTYYLQNPKARDERKNWILDRMAKLGYISAKKAEAAKKQTIKLVVNQDSTMLAPYFVNDVKKSLAEMYGEQNYQLMGLKVYTSLDYDLQAKAENTVNEWADRTNRWYNAKNIALTSIDPKTGEILAMVGGANFSQSQVNIWTPENALSFQSPGSAFKPIVYATAFKKGFTPDTILWDVKTDFGGYAPTNYDMKQRGPIRMKQALAQSLNIPAVKSLYLAGIPETINTAKSMGMIKTFDKSIISNSPDLSMAIGGRSIVPLELVSAYGVFATEGYRNLPTNIVKITTRTGKTIYQHKKSSVKVLDREVARTINSVLSDNSLRAPMFGNNSWINLGPWAAVKTGTAATETGKVTDVWTVGYTKNIVTGVWVGNNQNQPMYKNADGSNVAGPIWNQYMRKATANDSKIAFPRYKQIRTGKAILDGQVSGRHCILWWVNKDDPRGTYPQNASLDPQFIRWENAINGFKGTKTIPDKASVTSTPAKKKTTPTAQPKKTSSPTTTPKQTPISTPSITPTPTPTTTETPTPSPT